MDMFTDRLSQKLTAQEIIRANTTADLEELNRLKSRAAEYDECLAKMQELTDDCSAKLKGVQISDAGIRQEMESVGESLSQLKEQLESMDKSVAWQLEFVIKTLGEKTDRLCGQLEAQASGQLSEKLDSVEDNVHKECVKVYRNVQAVMVEESGKQKELLTEAKEEVASVKGKLGKVTLLAGLSMVFSLLGAVIAILGRLNVLPF